MQKEHPVLFFVMIVVCVLLKYAPAIINSIAELIKVLQ